MLSCGIIGLPNAGKSTLFNALTRASAQVANYPFTTVEPNVGIVEMRDERLRLIAEAVHPAKSIPAAMKFVDIAGLVKDAHKGEGLGNQFLGQIREVDAIVHVVRCFEDPNVVHLSGDIFPLNDAETVNLELIFADLETVERRLSKVKKPAESGIKEARVELQALEKAKISLQKGIPVRLSGMSRDERELLRELDLLTAKPEIYVANVSEEGLGEVESGCAAELKKKVAEGGVEVVVICAKLESDLLDLSEDEKIEYLSDIGIEGSGLDGLAKAAYELLGLITFFTAEPNESRAWPILRGSAALFAAGMIHSDIQRGFIKVEVVKWSDLVKFGSFHASRDAGKLMVEGKEYKVNDGDVLHFKFNV